MIVANYYAGEYFTRSDLVIAQPAFCSGFVLLDHVALLDRFLISGRTSLSALSVELE